MQNINPWSCARMSQQIAINDSKWILSISVFSSLWTSNNSQTGTGPWTTPYIHVLSIIVHRAWLSQSGEYTIKMWEALPMGSGPYHKEGITCLDYGGRPALEWEDLLLLHILWNKVGCPEQHWKSSSISTDKDHGCFYCWCFFGLKKPGNGLVL